LSDKVDSLKTKLNKSEGWLSNRVDSLKKDLSNKLDSLEMKLNKSADFMSGRVDSLKIDSSNKVDSLDRKLNKSAAMLSDRVDSLKIESSNKLDTLERKMFRSESLLINRVNLLETRKLDKSAAGKHYAQQLYLDRVSKRVHSLERKLESTDYALRFTGKTTNGFVIKHGMRSLTAVTLCVWIKSRDNRNGAALSYAVPGSDNELLVEIQRGEVFFWVASSYG